MKILQVSNRVPWPLDEGGTIGIFNFTRAYSELGHDVTLFCLDGLKHNTPVDEAKQELSKYAEVFIHPIDTDVKAYEILKHLLYNESYNVSRFYNKTFETELINLLSNNTFDVIQLEGTFVGPYVQTIRRNHNGLLALRMHNVEYEIWERLSSNSRNPFKKGYYKVLSKQLKKYEKELINNVDLITPVTDNDGTKFRKFNNSIPIKTIPAGIDLRHWQYAPSEQYINWYHIGSMQWHANVEAVSWYINEIHPLLVKENKNYLLHLAGKGINPQNFISNESIKIHPNVPDAYAFVKKLDVCIVPLKSGSGIRLKILEAMATGKLVVSTTIGAQGIDFIDQENILIANTAAEFLNVFRSIKSKSIDVDKIVKNARKLIENQYSTEALAKEQLEFYKSHI